MSKGEFENRFWTRASGFFIFLFLGIGAVKKGYSFFDLMIIMAMFRWIELLIERICYGEKDKRKAQEGEAWDLETHRAYPADD